MIRKTLARKLLCSMAAVILLTLPVKVSAFKPAAHIVVAEQTALCLPEDSKIRLAMVTYPYIVSWGSTGPDLGYAAATSALGYAPWADNYHYESVGSVAAEMLKNALASGDLKKIAFAAGWVTHIAGDLACHGIYVNPETGVYLDKPDSHKLHGELEGVAEKYVWYNLGGKSLSLHRAGVFDLYYAYPPEVPLTQMTQATTKLWGNSPTESEIRGWMNTFKLGLSSGVGYKYYTHDESMNVLNQGDRIQRLESAFYTAVTNSANLLIAAEAGDYSGFKDNWNLDALDDNRPIGTLTVSMKTASVYGAGTDDNVYFGMKLASGKTKEWLLDKSGYDDFEKNDTEDYFLYVGDKDFYPHAIQQVWLRIEKKGLSSDLWYVDSMSIKINGITKITKTLNTWLAADGTNKWSTNVNFGNELKFRDNIIRIPDMSVYFNVEGNKLIPQYLDSTFEEEANPYVYTSVGRIFYDETTKTPYKLTGVELIYYYNTDYYTFEYPAIEEVFK